MATTERATSPRVTLASRLGSMAAPLASRATPIASSTTASKTPAPNQIQNRLLLRDAATEPSKISKMPPLPQSRRAAQMVKPGRTEAELARR